MVLSELSDQKSWNGWSEEPGECLGIKETKSSHRADSCRPVGGAGGGQGPYRGHSRVSKGDTGASPGDRFLPQRARASQFPSHDFSHQGKAHSWGRQAPQISEAAQAGTWPRAKQACDREPVQVPVLPEVGELGTLFSDIFRSTHRVGCSGL